MTKLIAGGAGLHLVRRRSTRRLSLMHRRAAATAAIVLSILLGWLAVSPQHSLAQTSPDLHSSKIDVTYIPPKSFKHLSTMERLKSRQVLELLSQFLSPLQLPHVFHLETRECGEVNAYYDPERWALDICYEIVEMFDRIAPGPGESNELTHADAAIGGLVGVILHETGHAVFDMLDVPLLGREEDAADEMATFIALQFNKDVARAVAKGQAYAAKVFLARGEPRYSDEHGTGLQRYYNSLCLAYGGAPELFKEFVEKGDLPQKRAANCANEYQQIRFAFAKTILPFIDQDRMKQVQARQWLQFGGN